MNEEMKSEIKRDIWKAIMGSASGVDPQVAAKQTDEVFQSLYGDSKPATRRAAKKRG